LYLAEWDLREFNKDEGYDPVHNKSVGQNQQAVGDATMKHVDAVSKFSLSFVKKEREGDSYGYSNWH
jgi:hypothetical protein